MIWLHIAETDHRFDLENAKIIDHGRFKLERLVKGAYIFGRNTPSNVLGDPEKGQLHEESTCSREGAAMSVYGHADGRSSHAGTTFHMTNFYAQRPG